ncbi:MAG: hypothetical protein ACJ8F7_04230 [Gemmataceae bacterium]
MCRFLAPAVALALLASTVRADNTGPTTEIAGLKSKVPATWKQQEAREPRVYHFILPKTGDEKYDAELMVFHFPGGGGGVKANVDRWKGMVTPPEGKKIDDVTKVDEFKVGDVKVTTVDVAGTYLHKKTPMDATGEKRENYRLIGVVFEGANDTYFMRLVGPAKTIEANKKGFDGWLKNFK